MNKLLPIMHTGARPDQRAPVRPARARAAVVDAARKLVRIKGAVAFLSREKALAWADLQVAIDALESS